VLVDGAPLRSCITPIGTLGQSEITTLEGLGTLERPHPLQAAFMAEQAAQCGYCIAGMIMFAKALLDRNPQPSEGRGPAGTCQQFVPLRSPQPDRPRGPHGGASGWEDLMNAVSGRDIVGRARRASRRAFTLAPPLARAGPDQFNPRVPGRAAAQSAAVRNRDESASCATSLIAACFRWSRRAGRVTGPSALEQGWRKA